MFSPGAGSDPALFYLPASCLLPGSARRAGRFCTAAPTRRAAASGARAPAEELAIFLLPPPSHYNPLNLPHGPHALPAADRIVLSRHPVLQLLRIRSAILRILITAPSTALGVLFLFPWLNLGRCANLPPVHPSGNRCPALLPALSLANLPPVFHTIFT